MQNMSPYWMWPLAAAVAAPAAACLAAPDEISADRYTAAVRRFADTVLDKGLDRYGAEKTPLFVDGLHVQTLAPATWKNKGQTWVLCNVANQQPLMRTLDGLTAMTGRPKYRQAAEAATRHALEHLATPSGMLAWGGHMAWDLDQNKAVGEGGPTTHELKTSQPYFELMWRVNPAATQRTLEAIWAGHVVDWPLLDFNRHASVRKPVMPQWNTAFRHDISVPFPSVGTNLSFVNVVPPLMHAGVVLGTLGKSDPALTWTRRLVYRWQQGRDLKTGLCGGQVSFRQPDRAQQALGHVHPEINEAKIVASYHQTCRYHQLPLAQMQAGEDLTAAGGAAAALGREFITWASDDLKTYARECYESKEGHFIAKMTDGTPLQWKESRRGYYVPDSFAPRKPDGTLLWGYATAYRITRDEAHWRMTRELCGRLGLGDMGEPDGGRRTAAETKQDDFTCVYALLELHRATSDGEFLKLAARVGDNLLAMQSPSGLFPRPGRVYARTGDEIPLALLHLAAAMEGKSASMPRPKLDHAFFHCVYEDPLQPEQQKRDDPRTYDNLVYYGD